MLREGRAEEGETGKKPEMPPGRETGRRCPGALSGTGRMRTANLPESIGRKKLATTAEGLPLPGLLSGAPDAR